MELEEEGSKLPPGQRLVEGFPVLHVGEIPAFDPMRWDFCVFGLVQQPVRWTYQEFMALPRIQVVADFHCVTGFSVLGCLWEGVAFKEMLARIRLEPEARYVMVHCEWDYTTNLPLAVAEDDDVLFAYALDGQSLTPEHGWPLRLIVPKRYAWKSAKWVRGLEFLAQDRPGFWETRGYHNEGDPWKEERYG